MKRWIGFAGGAAAAAILLVAVPSGSSAPASAQAPAAKPVVGVDAFMKQPSRYPGPNRVEGVVSKVAAKERTLALIDAAEFEHCATLDCAKYTLPVRWGGPMPAVTDRVRVAGQIEKQNGKLVFVAQSLTKVTPKPKKP